MANWGSHDVSGFRLDNATGKLHEIKGSPYKADWFPYAVIVDPSAHFAYVANNGAGNISGYRIDAQTGALQELPGSPFVSDLGPYGLAISHFSP